MSEVQIYVELDDCDPCEIERLWAIHLDENLYCIHNVPFITYKYQYGDMVSVEWDARREMYRVLKTVAKSNRFETRFIVDENASETELKDILRTVGEYDCVLADGSDRWYSVSLAPEVDIEKFEETLLKYVENGVLTYDGDPFDERENFLRLKDGRTKT